MWLNVFLSLLLEHSNEMLLLEYHIMAIVVMSVFFFFFLFHDHKMKNLSMVYTYSCSAHISMSTFEV